MVCRIFAIPTLSFYLLLNNKMLELTGKDMFQRDATMIGSVFDAPVTCSYDVVLMEQYLSSMFKTTGWLQG